MAKFILGAIVTNIAGSIGGTTLRRVPNGLSMYNKIRGTSQSKLLKNNRLPEIGQIFQRWASLTDVERSGWNAEALLVTFPDKFGTQKNLTGRELFSKANIQLLPANTSISSSTGFTKDTDAFALDTFTVNLTDNEVNIIATSVTANDVLLISVEVSNKQPYQPVFKSRKVISNQPIIEGEFEYPFRAVLLANYPYIAVGMWVTVYVQVINSFGMVSPYQYLTTQAV